MIPNQSRYSLDTVKYKMERTYLEKEFIRFKEFVELSENAHEVEPLILDLKQKYHLLHI